MLRFLDLVAFLAIFGHDANGRSRGFVAQRKLLDDGSNDLLEHITDLAHAYRAEAAQVHPDLAFRRNLNVEFFARHRVDCLRGLGAPRCPIRWRVVPRPGKEFQAP